MTFEQWWEKREDKHLLDKTSAMLAFEWAWAAAQQNNKELVQIGFSRTYGWWVDSVDTGKVLEEDFESEEDAKQWASDNGYRLK